MLYILYGQDRQRKLQRLRQLESQSGLASVYHSLDNPPTSKPQLLHQDLFAGRQLIVLEGLLKEYLTDEPLDSYITSINSIVFLEDTLDKRTKLAGELLANKKVVTEEFAPPSFQSLPAWVKEYAKQHGFRIEGSAVTTLLERLGYEAESFGFSGKQINPGRLAMELDKLKLYTDGKAVTKENVELLVVDEQESVGFAVSGALAERNALELTKVLEKYYKNSDQAGIFQKTLLLTALLSEQFRSIWAYLESKKQGQTEAELLAVMGWKSGKLFNLRKAGSQFSQVEVLDILNKLELLDIEQKTTTLPVRVVVELVVSQLAM